MTENELIEWIESFKKTYAGFPKESEEACDAIISALKEIQNYRKLGTMEELARADTYIKLAKSHGTVGEMIDRCAAYEEIGIVEKCREAVEKQNPMNPKIHKDRFSNTYNCPKCGWTFIHKNETGWFCGQHYKFCPNCGQAIRWNENL